jgi:uncharacterized repeat protein (TIGR02543 family)
MALLYESIDATTCRVTTFNGVTPASVSVPTVVFIDGADKTVTSINAGAFYNRTTLVSISLPSSLIILGDPDGGGDGVFQGCTALSSIIIPENVTTINAYCFSGCSSLSQLIIPNSVMSIGEATLADCTSLALIQFPTGITTIPNYMFAGCSSLLYIRIPSTIASIGLRSFADCASLTSIAFLGNKPTFGDFCFENGYLSGNAIPAIAYRYPLSTGWPTPPTGVGDPAIPTDFVYRYIVTFDAQGGAGDYPFYKYINTETVYGTLPTQPTRDKYIFAGWYTAPEGQGIRIFANSLIVSATNHTLYAKWVQNVSGKVGCGACLVSLFVLGIGTDLFCEYIGSRLAKTTPQTIVRKLPKP